MTEEATPPTTPDPHPSLRGYWKPESGTLPSHQDIDRLDIVRAMQGRMHDGHIRDWADQKVVIRGVGEEELKHVYGLGNGQINLPEYTKRYQQAANATERQEIVQSALDTLETPTMGLSQTDREDLAMTIRRDLEYASLLIKRSPEADLAKEIATYREIKRRLDAAETARVPMSQQLLKLTRQGFDKGRGWVSEKSNKAYTAALLGANDVYETTKKHPERTVIFAGAVAVSATIALIAKGNSPQDFLNDIFGPSEGASGTDTPPSSPPVPGQESSPKPEPSAEPLDPSPNPESGSEASDKPTERESEAAIEKGSESEAIRRAIGKWDPKTGEGSVWGTVRGYAAELGLGLTEQELHDAVDKALIRDHVGGEGASYAERWEAAKHLQAEHEVSLSPDLFGDSPEGPATNNADKIETVDKDETKEEAPQHTETAEISKFIDEETFDPQTSLLEGTATNAAVKTATEAAKTMGMELNTRELLSNAEFRALLHDFVDATLNYNDLDWESAKQLKRTDTLNVPYDALQKFLDGVAKLTGQDTEKHVMPQPGEQAVAAVDTVVEARPSDLNQETLKYIFKGDPHATEFTHWLLDNPAKLHPLYPNMSVTDLQSYVAIHRDLPPAPLLPRDGRQYVDSAYVAAAHQLMQQFLNKKDDALAA